MFSDKTAPEWLDGDSCHWCSLKFSIIQRKYHCRACGQVFCSQCTMKTTTLPKYGIEKEVRVCDTCYDTINKPITSSNSAKQETELPPKYLKSSLAQQSQEPPKNSYDDLREEEELQLALALSQSEAEAKKKEFKKEPEPVVRRCPSPQQEETGNPELDRYLNLSYWESIQSNDPKERPTSPSAPSPASSIVSNKLSSKYPKSTDQHSPKKNDDNLRTEGRLLLALARQNEKLRVNNTMLRNQLNKVSETVVRQQEETNDPELDRHSYKESSIQSNDPNNRATSPSAPSSASSIPSNEPKFKIKENGIAQQDLEDFIGTLEGQLAIFINQMKSNSRRSRSNANDTSMQTFFLDITNLHSRLLNYAQDHYELLHDKLRQVEDVRGSLEAFREELHVRQEQNMEMRQEQKQLSNPDAPSVGGYHGKVMGQHPNSAAQGATSPPQDPMKDSTSPHSQTLPLQPTRKSLTHALPSGGTFNLPLEVMVESLSENPALPQPRQTLN